MEEKIDKLLRDKKNLEVKLIEKQQEIDGIKLDQRSQKKNMRNASVSEGIKLKRMHQDLRN